MCFFAKIRLLLMGIVYVLDSAAANGDFV